MGSWGFSGPLNEPSYAMRTYQRTYHHVWTRGNRLKPALPEPNKQSISLLEEQEVKANVNHPRRKYICNNACEKPEPNF